MGGLISLSLCNFPPSIVDNRGENAMSDGSAKSFRSEPASASFEVFPHAIFLRRELSRVDGADR